MLNNDELISELKKYFNILEAWYIDRMLNLSTQPPLDIYQLLLTARHFDISSFSVKRALKKIELASGPLNKQRSKIVESCLRQLVLAQYDLGQDERKRWYEYWLDEKNISGEEVVTVAYIVNLAAENMNLLSARSKEYVRNWHQRHKDLKAQKSRAWAPRALRLCGHNALAIERAQSLLSEREKNGSWLGGYGNTAAMTYALLHSGVVAVDDLFLSIRYIVSRLSRGITGDVALEANTLKVLKIANLLDPDDEFRMVQDINKDRSVFLSHSSDDHPFVRRLGRALANHGVKVWVDEAKISGGDSFVDKIEEGLAEMQHLIVVLSKESIKSFWVKRELNYALMGKVEAQQGKVIPLLLEDCEIPILLCERQYIDFRDDFNSGIQKLLRALNVEIAYN